MIKRLLLLMMIFTGAMTVMAQNDEETEGVILRIAPYTQECTGVGPQQCLVGRFADETELSFFYDGITGFTYETGFEYTLLVNINEIENPPADGSSIEYELVEVVSQLPAQITGKVWQLQSLYETDVENPENFTITFGNPEPDVYEAGMKADCNSVSADVTLDPFNITTTISTMAFCGEESLDRDYLDALNAVTMFSVENGELLLQSSEGLLRFAPSAIEASDWRMARQLGLASFMMFEDDSYTLSFDGEGQVLVTMICNQAEFEIALDGAVMELTGEFDRTNEAGCFETLGNVYPPERAVYYFTPDGNLVLEDSNGNLFDFVPLSSDE